MYNHSSFSQQLAVLGHNNIWGSIYTSTTLVDSQFRSDQIKTKLICLYSEILLPETPEAL